MATEPEGRHVLREDEGIQLSPKIVLNWKAWWFIGPGVFFLLTLVGGFFFSFAVPDIRIFVLYILGFAFFPWAIMVVLVTTGLLPRLYLRMSHAYHNLRGHNNYVSDSHERPVRPDAVSGRPRRRYSPKALGGRVDIMAHETDEGPHGQLWDHTYDTRTSVLEVDFLSTMGIDPVRRGSVIEAWGDMLNLFAEGGIKADRFAWQTRTLVGNTDWPDELFGALSDRQDLHPANLADRDTLLAEIAKMGREDVRSYNYLNLTIREASVKEELKTYGSVEEVLWQETQFLYDWLTGGEEGTSPLGVTTASFMSYNDLIAHTRALLDGVWAEPSLQKDWTSGNPWEFLNQEDAWPGNLDFEPPDICEIGSTFHAGFYIAGYPVRGLMWDGLWRVLSLPVAKTVTTVYKPLTPEQAERRAKYRATGAHSVSKDLADDEIRVDAFQDVKVKRLDEAETELAEGDGQVVAPRCYIDLYGKTPEEVLKSARLLKHVCSRPRFRVEPFRRRQKDGIAALLPVCRGLVDPGT